MKKTPIQHFRHLLAKGGAPVVGTSVSFTDPLITEALAPEVDFFWYDLEHCPMSFEVINAHMLAARGQGVTSLVRTPDGQTHNIKPYLDAGSDGIVVPQVESADEVRRIVADCRYPTVKGGRRGFGPRIPTQYGRVPALEYVKAANRDVFVSVMIETRSAVDQIGEIVSIPGLDAVVLGPMDLSGSLGVLGQVEHDMAVKAQKKVIAAAHRAGLKVGAGMGANPAYAKGLLKRGVDFIQLGGDFEYLINHFQTLKAGVGGRSARAGSRMYGR